MDGCEFSVIENSFMTLLGPCADNWRVVKVLTGYRLPSIITTNEIFINLLTA